MIYEYESVDPFAAWFGNLNKETGWQRLLQKCYDHYGGSPAYIAMGEATLATLNEHLPPSYIAFRPTHEKPAHLSRVTNRVTGNQMDIILEEDIPYGDYYFQDAQHNVIAKLINDSA